MGPKTRRRAVGDADSAPPNAAHESGDRPRNHPVSSGQERWNPEERDHHRKERRYWFWTSILTGLAVAGAIGTVVLSKWSLDQSEQAVAEAQKQSGIAQAAFEEGARAVIAIRGLTWDSPLKRDTDNVVNVVTVNVGKSPTAIFGTTPEIIPFVTDEKFGVKSMDVGDNNDCNPTRYSPGTIPSFLDTGTNNSLPVLINKELVNKIMDGGETIAIRGCVFYSAFDKTHYVGYCYVAAQKDQIASLVKSPLCAHGNFAR